MNRRVLFVVPFVSIMILACALFSPVPAPTATPLPPTVPPATATLAPTATLVPTDTPEPTPTQLKIILPQQWNGSYSQAGVGKLGITLMFDEMQGDTFIGKMFWNGTSNFRGAITKISGQFVQDFGDATEQAKWGNHPDYKNGDRSGIWVKWTEIGFVNGSGYTLGGWYYGHIQENGTMVGIYYLNDKITSFSSSDSWELEQVK